MADELHYALRALRAVSDLLCNAGVQGDMHTMNPENLNALLSIVADRLEQSLQ